jgi:hypothetical protein
MLYSGILLWLLSIAFVPGLRDKYIGIFVLSFDFTGSGFGDISAHIFKSFLQGFFGSTRLVDPCFVHLVIACAILNFDSRLDRKITISDLTGKMSSYLSENDPSIDNPIQSSTLFF